MMCKLGADVDILKNVMDVEQTWLFLYARQFRYKGCHRTEIQFQSG